PGRAGRAVGEAVDVDRAVPAHQLDGGGEVPVVGLDGDEASAAAHALGVDARVVVRDAVLAQVVGAGGRAAAADGVDIIAVEPLGPRQLPCDHLGLAGVLEEADHVSIVAAGLIAPVSHIGTPFSRVHEVDLFALSGWCAGSSCGRSGG